MSKAFAEGLRVGREGLAKPTSLPYLTPKNSLKGKITQNPRNGFWRDFGWPNLIRRKDYLNALYRKNFRLFLGKSGKTSKFRISNSLNFSYIGYKVNYPKIRDRLWESFGIHSGMEQGD